MVLSVLVMEGGVLEPSKEEPDVPLVRDRLVESCSFVPSSYLDVDDDEETSECINKVNAFVPEPDSVIEMVLADPVVADVMTRLLPTTATDAPAICADKAVAQFVRALDNTSINTILTQSLTVSLR